MKIIHAKISFLHGKYRPTLYSRYLLIERASAFLLRYFYTPAIASTLSDSVQVTTYKFYANLPIPTNFVVPYSFHINRITTPILNIFLCGFFAYKEAHIFPLRNAKAVGRRPALAREPATRKF